MLTETRLREILEGDLGCDLDGIVSGSLLFSTGVVDSFTLVTLIMEIEKETGLKVGPSDVTLENFDSMERILIYVSSATQKT